MNWLVLIPQPVEQELLEAAQWWAEHYSSEEAFRWHKGFIEALNGLRQNPKRCRVAREDSNFPFEIRELNYGLGSRPTHRAIYTIRDDVVLVLSVRHGAQEDIDPSNL